MMPITPSGTRILPTWMPLGRRLKVGHLADRVGQGGDLLEPSAIASTPLA
jgi:hypothetical protein